MDCRFAHGGNSASQSAAQPSEDSRELARLRQEIALLNAGTDGEDELDREISRLRKELMGAPSGTSTQEDSIDHELAELRRDLGRLEVRDAESNQMAADIDALKHQLKRLREGGNTQRAAKTATDREKEGLMGQISQIRKELNGRRLRERTKRLASLAEIMLKAEQLDLCFLVDCTGSMDPYVMAVQKGIHDILQVVGSEFQALSCRLAFVGYRDYDDDPRYSVLNFTHDEAAFLRFVESAKCFGGFDTAEDVFGGLSKAKALSWNHGGTSLVVHLADAPSHGSEFHEACVLDHHENDNGLAKEALEWISKKDVGYVFGRINSSTDVMITKFDEFLKPRKVYTIEIADLSKFVEYISKSISASISEARADKAGDVKRQLRPAQVETEMPNWDLLVEEQAYLFRYEDPKNVAEIIRSHSALKLEKIPGTFKVAKNPFGVGGCRLAYYVRETHHGRNWVGKISKYTGEKESKEVFLDEIEVQTVARALARDFGKLKSTPIELKFLKPRCIWFNKRSPPVFMNMEPLLKGGSFKKYNNNWGWVTSDGSKVSEALAAFSHWTHHISKGHLIVVDIQGIEAEGKLVLTDPAIHRSVICLVASTCSIFPTQC